MIFNSQQTIQDLLETAYSNGNCVFVQDSIYAPVSNVVKKIDLKKNQTSILAFQNPHHNALIAITPNKTLIIAIDYSGHATIFNLHGHFVVGQFNFKHPVKKAIFSSNSQLLGIAQDNGFSVYECASTYRTFQPLVLIKKYKSRHSAKILSLQFSPDNRFLVTCGEDNLIYINNLFPINDYMPISLQAHRYKIIATHFSYNKNYLYSFDSGNNIFVWKLINQKTQAYNNLVQSKKRANKNRKGGQIIQELRIQQNLSEFQIRISQGRYVLSKKIAINQGGYLKKIVYKSQMGFLAGAYSNGKFSIWKLIDEELQEVQTFSIGEHKVTALAVNDSCTWLALGIKQLGQLIVWQWKSQSYIINQKGFIHQTKQIAYNNVNIFATGTTQGLIRLWDANSHFSIASLNEHQAAISGLKFSNSSTLFSCSLDGTLNAYDINKHKKFRTFHPDVRCQLVCLELDPNGQVVFSGSFEPYDVYSWNVQTGHLLQVITGHQGPLACLAFTNNNLVTASWDKTVKIHAIFSRKLNVETLEHGSQITAISVHPLKNQVAVATMKGQIYIWQTENGRLEGVLQSEINGGKSYFSKISAQNDPSTKYLKALAYSTCGKYLFGGGKSKYIYVYDIDHRMLLSKINLTNNKDIQGVVQKLNSRFVKNGVPTYQLELQVQNQVYSQDEKAQKIPGSTKIDISQLRTKLQVEVRKIVVKNNKQLLVSTSFGTLILSSNQKKSVFNPYELSPNLSPKLIAQLVNNKDFTSALLVSLKLNINPRKLLKKIQILHVKSVICELQENILQLLLEKISQGGKITLREAIWVQQILRRGIKAPVNMRGAFQSLDDQANILMECKGRLQMAVQLGHSIQQ